MSAPSARSGGNCSCFVHLGFSTLLSFVPHPFWSKAGSSIDSESHLAIKIKIIASD